MTNLLQHAESLVTSGFSIFPVKYRDKIPLTKNGFKDASISFEQLKTWDKQFQEYNIGIRTGDGLAVIDVDTNNGGTNSWIKLTENNPVPDTVCAQTGGGGRHFFFKGNIKNTASKLAPGVDTRGEGGYVVSPPSIHASGKAYEWLPDHGPDEIELAALPDFLNPGKANGLQKDFINKDNLKEKVPSLINSVSEGSRNDSLARYAGKFIQKGLDLTDVLEICHLWNRQNSPPLSDTELRRTVESIYNTDQNNHPEKDKVFEKDIQREEELVNLLDSQLDVGGVIGMMQKEILTEAYMKQPILTFGACTTFFATVIGKFYKLRCDTRSNLYTVGIADTGAGKQDIITGIEIIANASGLGHLIDAESVTSGQAILKALEYSSIGAIYFPFDEIGDMLASISGKLSANFEKEKATVLSVLYTSSNKTYKGKRYADGKRIEIDQPMANMYATGNPNDFFEAVTIKMIKSGLFGRLWCLFARDNNPKPNYKAERLKPSDALTNNLSQWASAFIPYDKAKGNIEQLLSPDPIIIETSEQAKKVFMEYDAIYRQRKKDYANTRNLDCLWVRPLLIAKKNSLTFTCSNALTPRGIENHKPQVTREVAELACGIALTSFDRICLECQKNVIASDFEGIQRDIIDCIRRRGKLGATKSDLCRGVRRWNPIVRDQAMSVLVGAGLIFQEIKKNESNNKDVITFFIAK